MKWLYLRGVFHNPSNINKIKFEKDGSVVLYLVGDSSPTVYYDVTEAERRVITKLINNDGTTDS